MSQEVSNLILVSDVSKALNYAVAYRTPNTVSGITYQIQWTQGGNNHEYDIICTVDHPTEASLQFGVVNLQPLSYSGGTPIPQDDEDEITAQLGIAINNHVDSEYFDWGLIYQGYKFDFQDPNTGKYGRFQKVRIG